MIPKRKAVLAIFLLVAFLFICGCGQKLPSNKTMVDHIEQKYNSHFSYYCLVSKNKNGKAIYCTSEEYPDCLIWVKYDSEQNKYTDTFIPKKYQRQAEKMLADTLSDLFPEGSFAYLQNTMGDGTSEEGASGKTTFAEFARSPKSCLSAVVILNKSKCGMSLDEAKRCIVTALTQNGMFLVSCDVFCTEENIAGALNDVQFSDFVAKSEYERSHVGLAEVAVEGENEKNGN